MIVSKVGRPSTRAKKNPGEITRESEADRYEKELINSISGMDFLKLAAVREGLILGIRLSTDADTINTMTRSLCTVTKEIHTRASGIVGSPAYQYMTSMLQKQSK